MNSYEYRYETSLFHFKKSHDLYFINHFNQTYLKNNIDYNE